MNTTSVNLKPSQTKPWLKYFPDSSLDAQLTESTMYVYLKQVCQKRGEKPAIYYYGTRVSYKKLLENIELVADAFYTMGVRKGEIVSLLTVTTPDTVYIMYALNKIGAVCNFIDPRMDVVRIRDAVKDVGSRFLVTLDLPFPKVEAIMPQLALDKIIVTSANDSLPWALKMLRRITTGKGTKIPYGDNIIKWKQFLSKRSSSAVEAPYEKGRTAVITYTGGTTGSPKGVELGDDGMNAVAESFRLSGVAVHDDDRFLDIMPVFSSYGVVCGLHMPFGMGVENVIVPSYTPDELGGMIRKYRPNHMMGVPSFYERIMHSRELWDVDLSFLRTTGCGGDTMNPGLEKRFNGFMKEHGAPHNLSQGYGMSEVTGSATCCFGDVYKDDSAGIPLLHVTVGIFKPESTEELDCYQEGEICLAGPTVMNGYYGKPEETGQVLVTHPDGKVWVHSGDIGYLDEDGFLFIKGRIKQIIIRYDGHKIFPVQIESVVCRHKAVGTCSVIGVQDPDNAQGEVPLIVVELKKTLDEPVDKEALRLEILQLCDREMEERGKPSDLVFIDEMPHTAMGKNNVLVLQEMYKDHVVRPFKTN